MQYNSHGGQCCGYGHVHGFDHATEADLDRCIENHRNAARGNNRVLEAILTDRQLNPSPTDNRVVASVRDSGGWATILARKGFRLAAEWVNSNTERRCYQFLLIQNLLSDQANYRRGFNWTDRIQVPQRPPAVEEIPLDEPVVPVVGMTVRNLSPGSRMNQLGEITRVSERNFLIRWEDGEIISKVRPARHIREVRRIPNAGMVNHPVDPNFPVAIRNLLTGEVVTAVIRSRVDGICTAYTTSSSRSTGNRDLQTTYSYDLSTGLWSGADDVARLFNSTQVEILPDAPAAPDQRRAPGVVLREYFAVFADGRRRGVFATEGEAREAYPRVRTIAVREVLSDGTTRFR